MSYEGVHGSIGQVSGIYPCLRDRHHRRLGQLAGDCAPWLDAEVVENRDVMPVQSAIRMAQWCLQVGAKPGSCMLDDCSGNLLDRQKATDGLKDLQLDNECNLRGSGARNAGCPLPLIQPRSKEV